MSTQQPFGLDPDRRAVAAENASYRWGYVFVSYALLADVLYRAAVRREAAWDLLTLIVIVGSVCLVFQARQQAVSRAWAMKAALLACAAGVIAAILAISRGL